MSSIVASTPLDEFLAAADSSGDQAGLLRRAGSLMGMAGFLLAIGSVAVMLAMRSVADERVRLRQAIAFGGILAAVGATVELVGVGDTFGVGWVDALRHDQGSAAMMRLIGGALVAVGLLADSPTGERERSLPVFSFAGVVVGAVSFGFAGHTMTRGPRILHALADLVHVTAAGVWFGGLVAVSLVAFAAGEVRRAWILHRFSTMATAMLVLVGAAGVVMATLILDGLGDLTGTAWGRLFVLKVCLVGAAACLGGYHHFVVVPALVADPGDLGTSRRAGVTVRVEAALLVTVLVVTAWLITASPR